MPQIDAMVPIIKAVGAAMTERFSHFILLDLGELERDQLPSADAPYLPPFEIIVSATSVFFLMNGKPLERDGKYVAFRRVPAKGEVRSSIHVQGTAETVTVTDKILLIAETVRPKLVQDGMFLVGLDIVGDKILEINVFTPGGLWSMSQMYKTDFMESVIIALENKLTNRASYPNSVPNREPATL